MKKIFVVLPIALIVLNIALGGYYLYLQYFKKQPYSCPVPKEYCKKGKVITIKGKYYGIGYNLPQNTSLYSMFDGQLNTSYITFSQELGGGTYQGITIVNDNSKETAVYLFNNKNNSVISRKVNSNEAIANLESENISNFKVNLIVKIIRNVNGKTETVPIKTNNFK